MRAVLALLTFVVFAWADAFSDGLAAANRGDNQEAIRQFTQAIKSDPNNARAYYERGLLYGDIGDYKKAIEDYTRAININPNYADAYVNRGFLYAEFDHLKAIEDFTQAIKSEPNYAWAYDGRGNSYLELGDRVKAEKDARKACDLSECELLQFLRENGQISEQD
ncbi:hypothetical protein FACS1894103_6030 [Campylobacterota bacterium]|nr:hypothetical protein FACS1894103_6030 [Campylobacterota bacterium]